MAQLPLRLLRCSPQTPLRIKVPCEVYAGEAGTEALKGPPGISASNYRQENQTARLTSANKFTLSNWKQAATILMETSERELHSSPSIGE